MSDTYHCITPQCKMGCKGCTNLTSEITALEIEDKLYGQETLFVSGVFNWQSVSGSLEPTSKENIRAGDGNLSLGDPQAGESLCAHFVCLNNSFWTQQAFTYPSKLLLASFITICGAGAGYPLIKHSQGQTKLGTFSKQTMERAGPYL